MLSTSLSITRLQHQLEYLTLKEVRVALYMWSFIDITPTDSKSHSDEWIAAIREAKKKGWLHSFLHTKK